MTTNSPPVPPAYAHVTVLGASGATGRLLVPALLRRGHDVAVVVQNADRAPAATSVLVGNVRDRSVLAAAVSATDAVVSALGPVGKDSDLHQTMAKTLAGLMAEAGLRRYVGVSGAGMDAPGDRKRLRDRVISRLLQAVPGAAVADKAAELAVWQDTDLDWTLVRPPRLTDAPATGRLEHHASRSPKGIRLTRADLAEFLADVLEQDLYVRQVPFVANT